MSNHKVIPVGYNLFLTHMPSDIAIKNFFYVQAIGQNFANGSYLINRINCDSFILQVTISGKGYLDYRDKHYEILPGNCMLLNCYDKQVYYADKNLGWHFKWLHFFGCSSKGYFDLIYDKIGPVIDLGDCDFLYENLDSMMNQIQNRDIDFEINASIIIHKFLSHILLFQQQNNERNTKSNIMNVINYIEENFAKNITHTQMAIVASYSEFYLYRIFKIATGFSPHEYLVKYRLNKAKYLLKSTDFSIEQIASMVGFENSSHFITSFKNNLKITPKKYRDTNY